MLGWTGEKIVLVGDSAGGLLSTNIVQRAILAQVRVPDVLVPIYTPFLSNYRFEEVLFGLRRFFLFSQQRCPLQL